jgi:hypothetical protein
MSAATVSGEQGRQWRRQPGGMAQAENVGEKPVASKIFDIHSAAWRRRVGVRRRLRTAMSCALKAMAKAAGVEILKIQRRLKTHQALSQ